MTPHDDLIRRLRDEIEAITDECFDAESAGDNTTARGKLLIAIYAAFDSISADALERQQRDLTLLTAERDRLREALEKISQVSSSQGWRKSVEIAQAALAQQDTQHHEKEHE